MNKNILVILSFILFSEIGFSLVSASEVTESPKIEKYVVEIRPDLKTKIFSGKSILFFHSKSKSVSFLTNDLKIDELKVDDIKVPFAVQNKILKFSQPVLKKIQVLYHGSASEGLVFGDGYLYSAYDTCTWMICNISPGEKSIFEISVFLPKDIEVVASGVSIQKIVGPDEIVQNVWREERPYSDYLFGFAAANFQEYESKIGTNIFKYLGVLDTKVELKAKFKDSEQMFNFLLEKAGVPLPHRTYVQVLVPGDEAQEKSSFAIIGKSNLDPIMNNPQEDWAIVHELAHQWWGNLITCKTWQHFWLNEGITVFMVAAYKERRWGKEAYETELALAQKRYQRAIDEKFDVPLSFAGEYPSLRIKRAIIYNKGALFMAALRKNLGETLFWKGLKEYTIKFAGKSVETKDFQNQMQKSTGHNLDELFKSWAY